MPDFIEIVWNLREGVGGLSVCVDDTPPLGKRLPSTDMYLHENVKNKQIISSTFVSRVKVTSVIVDSENLLVRCERSVVSGKDMLSIRLYHRDVGHERGEIKKGDRF